MADATAWMDAETRADRGERKHIITLGRFYYRQQLTESGVQSNRVRQFIIHYNEQILSMRHNDALFYVENLLRGEYLRKFRKHIKSYLIRTSRRDQDNSSDEAGTSPEPARSSRD